MSDSLKYGAGTTITTGESESSGTESEQDAIHHFREAIRGGRHWYLALLEAIGMWTVAEETWNGRHYCYLIGGEAFDWLLLAERLCLAIDNLVLEKETIDLLFFSRPPLELNTEEFRKLIGHTKYRAYLNYFYGITLEETIFLVIKEEVRKEKWGLGLIAEGNVDEEAFNRLYGASRKALLEQFQSERGYPNRGYIYLEQLKEFTYWLFKYRVNKCDPARVASDTKKGLEELYRQHSLKKADLGA